MDARLNSSFRVFRLCTFEHGGYAANRGDSTTGARSIRLEATVQEALPNALFRVALPDGRSVVAHVASDLRLHVVRILPGHAVTVELSRYDASRGRIVGKREGRVGPS